MNSAPDTCEDLRCPTCDALLLDQHARIEHDCRTVAPRLRDPGAETRAVKIHWPLVKPTRERK